MTSNNISLSIIMPAYNEENRLPETINMFIEWKIQNSDLNIELIIVNDGSTDKTDDIILSFHRKYSWIKLINEKHVGMMNAIISGIKKNLNIPLSLKWPNDLYHDNKKLGGVLIESKKNNESTDTVSRRIAWERVNAS